MKTLAQLLACIAISVLTIPIYSCSDGKDDNNNDDNKTSGYFYHDGHSYLIVKETKTWVQAAADAVSKGGYLVEINSKEEQDAIYNNIKGSGISSTYTKVIDGGGAAYIWIGATDRASEGNWKWNGTNSNSGGILFWKGDNNGSSENNAYYNWGGKSAGKVNEPDNYTDSQYSPNGQNAAAIGLAKWPEGSSDASALGKAGEWNDIAETNKIYYIIEFDTKK